MEMVNQEQTQLTRLLHHGEGLDLKQLLILMDEALNRWEQLLGERPKHFSPVLRGYNPLPKVEFSEGDEASQLLDQLSSGHEKIIFYAYLVWNRHSLLSSYPNPFEPMIGILHHRGTFERPENNILPIIDYLGRCGAIYPNYRFPHQ